MTGFFFGLFVFTFVLSGLISVTNVPDWMVGVRTEETKAIKWNQKLVLVGHQNMAPKEIYSALHKKYGVRKIEWLSVMGAPQYQVYYSDYEVPEVYTLKNGEIQPLESFSVDDIKDKAEKLFGDASFTVQVQRGYDNYYSPNAMRYYPLTSYKIELGDEAKTCLYINPQTGREIIQTTKNSRMRVWLYRFLHALDIPFFKNVEILRKIILIIISIGGLIVSVSGLVLSVKWFKRQSQKSKKKRLKNKNSKIVLNSKTI